MKSEYIYYSLKNICKDLHYHSQKVSKLLDELEYDAGKKCFAISMLNDEGIVLGDIEMPTDNEIYSQIAFQEQFFYGVLVR